MKKLAVIISLFLLTFFFLARATNSRAAVVTPSPTPTDPASPTDTPTPTPSDTPTDTPTPTPCGEFCDATPTPTDTPTATPCVSDPNAEFPVDCPTDTPAPTSTPGDVCTNIDGFQATPPDGWYQVSPDNTDCRQFQMPGPPDGGGNNGGGSSSGGSSSGQGQVLGASTMASAGYANNLIGGVLASLGLLLVASSAYVYRKKF